MKTVRTAKKSFSKKTATVLSPIRRGNTVFVRTVTHYYTGRIVHISQDEIVLDDVAWIADTGRFSAAMQTGELNEIEPYPTGVLVSISRGAMCDVSDWKHTLPRSVK